jgi:hypothetical protein
MKKKSARGKIVVEHMGLKLTRPDAKTAAKINRAVKHAEKTGQRVSDRLVRPHAYKK